LTSLAQRVFSVEDQERFALVSGDWNPIHLDAAYAKRTVAGAKVVHGINMVLWALDSFANAHPESEPLRSVRVQFNKFVYVGELAEVVLAKYEAASGRLNISVGGELRSKISISFGEPIDECAAWEASSQYPVSILREPLDPGFEGMYGSSGRVPFQMSAEDAVALFPAAADWFGSIRVRALAASSYLVGMVCPGLHSIYSALSINACTQSFSEEGLAYRVIEADERFQLIEQEIAGGGWGGSVSSLMRPLGVEKST